MLLITAITGWLCTVCIGAQLLRWPDTRDLERRLRVTRRLNRALKIEIRKRPRVKHRDAGRETRDAGRGTSRNAVYVSLLSAHGLDMQRATVGAMMLDAMDASAAASVLASGVKPLVAWLKRRDDAQVHEFLTRNGGTK